MAQASNYTEHTQKKEKKKKKKKKKKEQCLTSFSQSCVEQEKLHQVLLFQFAESLHSLPPCHYSPWKPPKEARRQNSEALKQQILICWEPNWGNV